MTGQNDDASRRSAVTRRRLLAATATGLTGTLAGCGYRPGGGDLAWESTLSAGGPFGPGRRWFVATDDRLVTVRNQSGRTYDFEAEEWRDVENAAVTAIDGSGTIRIEAATERQAVGPPAVTGDSVFVPVEGDRVTAIDRDAAAIDPEEPGTASGQGGAGTREDDEIRWQVDGSSADSGESTNSGSSADNGEPATGGESSEIVAVRASSRLAVAVGRSGIVALDAGSGERAFAFAGAWSDGTGDPRRVVVDGEEVWVVADGGDGGADDEADGNDDGGGDGDGSGDSGDGTASIVRFDPAGNRLAEREVSDDIEWLLVAGETLLASDGRGTVIGFDRDLDRIVELAVPTSTGRPAVVDSDSEERVYLRHGGTVLAVDIDDGTDAGRVAWERSDVPTRRGLAVDEDGVYGVDSREGEPVIVAIGADGKDRWTAPLPEDVHVEELFAVDDRLIVVADGALYGLHADPGERWSLIE